MSRQIPSLVKSIKDMSDDELLSRLRDIRHKRTIPPPVSVKKRPTKEAGKAEEKVDKLLTTLSEKDKQLLMSLLGGDE